MGGVGRWGGAVTVAAFLALAILRFDLIVEIRRASAKGLAVQNLPSLGLHSRAVLVDLGDRTRVIRTHDRYVATHIGAKVCIAERRYLVRSFSRFSIELSSYCPDLGPMRQSGDSRTILSPGD